jgi:TolB-like protein/tetratricopeptide (TPR) repeat protein
MEVFALANEGLSVPKREQMSGKLKEFKKKNIFRRNIIIGISALILLIAGIFLYLKYFNQQNNEIDKSIAILPFRNLSRDTTQEYYAEGMMDEVFNNLYKIGGLIVISKTSSLTYKDSKKTSKEIASELGVGNLLSGSVRMEGDHIRIIVQLINGKTDQNIWTETYNSEFKDVFVTQSKIAQQIAAALKVKIDPETKSRIEYIPTENTSAYNLYLQARESALNNGWKELLEKVIQLDSSFAPAYADLGFYWLSRGIFNGDLNAKQVLDSALPLLRTSIQLDSNLASAHNYMAQAHLWFEWDFKSTEQEWKKFFQLNPSGIIWADNYVNFLQSSGRFQDALVFSQQNRDNDKNNFDNWEILASCYIYVNQPDKGLVILDSASSLIKHLLPSVFWIKAFLFIYLGKYQQSIDNLNKYFEVVPDARNVPRMQAELSISYFHTGRVNEAEKIVDRLRLRSKQSPVGSPAFFTAMVYAATGRKELALQWLEKAYTDHEVEMFWLKVEPLFKPLHDDPRFQELLTRVGFK